MYKRQDWGAADAERAIKRGVGNVGDIDHHAETVHLVDNVFAEFGEAFFGVRDGSVVDVAGAVGPVSGVGPGERHVANTESVVLAEKGEGVLDGVAAFNSHERGELVVAMSFFDARRCGDELNLIGVSGDLLLDRVDQLEGAAGILAFIELGLDPDGKELGAEVALVDGVEVEISFAARIGEIEVLVKEALGRVGVGIKMCIRDSFCPSDEDPSPGTPLK